MSSLASLPQESPPHTLPLSSVITDGRVVHEFGLRQILAHTRDKLKGTDTISFYMCDTKSYHPQYLEVSDFLGWLQGLNEIMHCEELWQNLACSKCSVKAIHLLLLLLNYYYLLKFSLANSLSNEKIHNTNHDNL